MHNITTSLNESEYELFRKKAQRMNMTDYELTKTIIKLYLLDQNVDFGKIKIYLRESFEEFIKIMDCQKLP